MKKITISLLFIVFAVVGFCDVATAAVDSNGNVIHNSRACWSAPTKNTDGSPLTDLAGFRVYTGTVSNNYDQFFDFPDPVRTCVLFSEMKGMAGDFYVAITAYNSLGIESGYSNEELAQGVIGGLTDNIGPTWGQDQGNLHFEP